ncbi:MAG: malonyl-CoA decarboxylase [Pseudomonadota bacterium]
MSKRRKISAAMATHWFVKSRSPDALADLVATTEARRQELLRRLNFAPGGTEALVRMRSALLSAVKDNENFKRVDADFQHLLASWFNRGFLVLRPIDWNTPAQILEKIIEYEAVHEIDSWDELRRRLQPADRRCFAFFHPAMPNEPLIFVEVALTGDIASSIQDVLAPTRDIIAPGDATTAVFYSISNCQRGLKGVSFGNFLIKQVAQDLGRALPGLKTFVTLSPVPGFGRWVRDTAKAAGGGPAAEALTMTADMSWARDPEKAEAAKAGIMALAAEYFLEAKRGDGQPLDPVARFHLSNGASLARINWLADTSAKGLAQSFGVMVNYLYELDQVEAHHEDYAEQRTVHSSRTVRGLLPPPDRSALKTKGSRS